MNLDKLKTPVMIFMAGGFCQYVEHYHRSILNHGYHMGLMVAGAAVVYTLVSSKIRRDATIQQEEQAERPAISMQTVEGHTINLKTKQAAR
jgi:hypothetical protein